MTPERMAALVARWARFYTRDLPAPVAGRRREEIDADVHEQIAHERARGTGDRRIALSLAARMLKGMAADASWRRRTRARPGNHRPAVRVAAVTALILLVPLVGMQVSDQVNWSVADFVFAGVLLAGTGFLLELAVRRRDRVAYRVAGAAIGVAAIALGDADDAPGLVLFGCLVIVAMLALTIRTAVRRE
jgi:hypothetical protein